MFPGSNNAQESSANANGTRARKGAELLQTLYALLIYLSVLIDQSVNIFIVNWPTGFNDWFFELTCSIEFDWSLSMELFHQFYWFVSNILTASSWQFFCSIPIEYWSTIVSKWNRCLISQRSINHFFLIYFGFFYFGHLLALIDWLF